MKTTYWLPFRKKTIAVWVADNVIDKDLLHQVFSCILYEDDYSENVKLALLEAIDSAERTKQEQQ